MTNSVSSPPPLQHILFQIPSPPLCRISSEARRDKWQSFANRRREPPCPLEIINTRARGDVRLDLMLPFVAGPPHGSPFRKLYLFSCHKPAPSRFVFSSTPSRRQRYVCRSSPGATGCENNDTRYTGPYKSLGIKCISYYERHTKTSFLSN